MIDIFLSYLPTLETATKVVILGVMLRGLSLLINARNPIKPTSIHKWIMFDSFVISTCLTCGAAMNQVGPYYSMFWLRTIVMIASLFGCAYIGQSATQTFLHKKTRK